MKKIILTVIVTLLCAGLVNAEKLYLSYTEGKNYTGAPVGIGSGDNMWIDMAIKIPGSTIKAMAGAKITGVNGSCTSIADIETVHAWLRTDLEGENPIELGKQIREHCAKIGLEIIAYAVGGNFLAEDPEAEIQRLCGCVEGFVARTAADENAETEVSK